LVTSARYMLNLNRANRESSQASFGAEDQSLRVFRV
jgi:hypothetical protein